MTASPTPTIRAHLLRPYVEALEAKRLPYVCMLTTVGLSAKDLEAAYARVPLERFIAFTELSASVIGDEHLGLKLGSVRRPEQIGALGLLITTAPTLRDGLTGFLTWMRGLQEATQIELVEERSKVDYLYRVHRFEPAKVRQDVEFTLASYCSLIRARLGGGWSPMEVHFEHSAPNQTSIYERAFGAPVFFDQPVNKIVIRRAELDHINRDAGFVMGPLIEQHLRILSSEMDQEHDLSQRVTLVIARRLGRKPITLQGVAAETGLSVRSLQRHLMQEGVTFRDLVKSQRRRVVENLLGGRQPSSVTAAALSAGYSDGTTLSRAFKSWTGKPPRRFAKQWTREAASIGRVTEEGQRASRAGVTQPAHA